ncbi:MAG: hypothetical protein CM15mP106_5290 [Candidatus Neomarinimicrobiota bacterium]|nr:MAG: hypothetical protein CM15mP106_5290 [Candidatus Neomarinimicrobiota bacterium]
MKIHFNFNIKNQLDTFLIILFPNLSATSIKTGKFIIKGKFVILNFSLFFFFCEIPEFLIVFLKFYPPLFFSTIIIGRRKKNAKSKHSKNHL